MLHLPRQAFAAMTVLEEAIHLALSPLEEQVVFLSLKDHRRTATEEVSLRRFLRRLVGQRSSNQLADPRLEALRVFSILYRHDRSVLNQQFRVNGPVDRFLEPTAMLAAAQVIDRLRNSTN